MTSIADNLVDGDPEPPFVGMPDVHPQFGHLPWTVLTLLSGWLHSGSPLRVRRWRGIDSIQLSGFINGGALANGTVIAQLPMLARPLAVRTVSVAALIPATSNYGVGLLTVNTAGDLAVGYIPANNNVFFDGCFYNVD